VRKGLQARETVYWCWCQTPPPIHRSNEVKQLAYFLEIFTGWEYLGGLEYLVVGNILGMAIHRAVKKDGWVIERFYENQSRRTA